MVIFFIFIIGLIAGSFLNVCIYRIPREKSLLYPPSHCPQCENPIKWFDNIPLVSYLLLKGKCRFCHHSISIRYPLVEAFTGILFSLSYFFHPSLNILFFKNLIFISFLIPIFFIDLEKKIIPNSLSYGLIISGIIFGILTRSFFSSLWGTGLASAIFLAIYLVGYLLLREEGIGMGDIKMAMGIGAFLGWKISLVAFFISFLFGAVVAILLLLTGLKKRKDKLPFAPFLTSGALISLFYGERLLHLYLTL